MIYATTPTDTDLASEDQLARASLAVDNALIGALYDTDSDGAPTSAKIITALRDATVAQARAIARYESETGRLKSASIGSASFTYDQHSDSLTIPAGGGLCPDAAAILQLAGLTPGGVSVYG